MAATSVIVTLGSTELMASVKVWIYIFNIIVSVLQCTNVSYNLF